MSNTLTKGLVQGNLAAVLHAVEDIKLESVNVPEVGDHDLLIKMQYVGVCGSDIHFYKEGYIAGNFKLGNKLIIGHEASGIVAEMGSKVDGFQRGDRVVLEPGVPCSRCLQCKSGSYNLCPHVQFNSVPPYAGFLRQYCSHPAEYCYKVPASVSMQEASLVEPLSVALHTMTLAEFSIGQSVLICGAGSVGLLHLLVARCYGASRIIITDLDEDRLKFAKTLGADKTIQVSGNSELSDVADQIANSSKETSTDRIFDPVDLTVECSGAPFSFQLAVEATKPGGKVALVGLSARDDMQIDVGLACSKELQFLGVRRYVNCFPAALELLSKRRLDLRPLVSHCFKLDEAQLAMETASSRDTKAIKVIIDCFSETEII